METEFSKLSTVELLERFKKNSIVWKLNYQQQLHMLLYQFKKNSIVWKREAEITRCSLALRVISFKKNSIVWKRRVEFGLTRVQLIQLSLRRTVLYGN